ncbi:MAG: hypothetical protein U0625_05815 [Phycisphaerales bacterium]
MPIRRFRTGSPAIVHTIAATVALGAVTHAGATDKHWNVAGGVWSLSTNWSPTGVPQAADAVFIGSSVAALNATVTSTTVATIAALQISDGMRLQCDGAALTVTGDALVTGRNIVNLVTYRSMLRINNGAAQDDLRLANLSIQDEGAFELLGGSRARIDGAFEIGTTGRFTGDGTLLLTSNDPVAMRLNGLMFIGTNGLTIVQQGAGRIDLDGDGAEFPSINATGAAAGGSAFAAFTVVGSSLADDYDGKLAIGFGNRMTMDLSDGWEMGSTGQINMLGSQIVPNSSESVLDGTHLLMHGRFSSQGADGPCRLLLPLTIDSTQTSLLFAGSKMQFEGATHIQAMTISASQGASARFLGATTVNQLTASTPSLNPGDGAIEFVGPVVWDGHLGLDGAARTNGTAVVVGPTTVDGGAFHLDGGVGGASWELQDALTLNVVEVGPENTFGGQMSIGPGGLGRIAVNLATPGDTWEISGGLTTVGDGSAATIRVAGSPLVVSGELAIPSGEVAFTAHALLATGSTTELTDAAAALHLDGGGSVMQGAAFNGAGTLVGGPGTTLTLEPNANLGTVGLRAEGTLVIGASPSAAFVDRIEFGGGATWTVEVGGRPPHTPHDVLFVTGGTATLGGSLDVRAADQEGGAFEPTLGDSFAILQSPGGIRGDFSNTPVTHANGKAYVWAVELSRDRVTLRLVRIAACPADLSADGQVDGADLGALLAQWGGCTGCSADFNQDGIVNGADLGTLLAAWGGCL